MYSTMRAQIYLNTLAEINCRLGTCTCIIIADFTEWNFMLSRYSGIVWVWLNNIVHVTLYVKYIIKYQLVYNA